MNTHKLAMTALRLVMSFIFLWAFIDKIFGLGFATPAHKGWIDGVSPTAGFLAAAAKGPFASVFHGLAGNPIVDWLFMLGLLFIGLSLLTNKFVKWGCAAGSAMLALMYLSLLFPANNPLIDEHIVYILVLALIGAQKKGA
jgi:thiosulfate dehydrogenase [quinone] large subunit